MQRKVLFLIVEVNSASGFCAQNAAEELIRRGCEVHFLTRKRNGFQSDAGIHIHAIYPDQPTTKHSLYPPFFKKMFRKLSALAVRARVVLWYPLWPRNNVSFLRRFTSAAKELVRKYEIDTVIPVYNTIDALIAADEIKKADPGIVVIPYLLDAFYGGQTPKLMPESIKKKMALHWEHKLFRRADSVIMMQAARKAYEKDDISPEYLHKTVFLDIPMLLPSKHMQSVGESTSDKQETIFLFIGSMPRNIRDPGTLLEVFSSIAEPDWQLHLVGPTDFEKQIDAAAKRDPRIKRFGMVSHQQAVERMQSADYLINIGNTLSYMVPSKIFEYMSFNKPIISTYKIEDDPCLPYLDLYQNAIAIAEKNDIEKNAELLRRFVDATKSKNHSDAKLIDRAASDGVLYHNTPAAFADHIDRVRLDHN